MYMNDFLQNLRSNSAGKPGHSMARNTHDATFHSPKHQSGFKSGSSQPYKNKPPIAAKTSVKPQLQEVIFNLNNHIHTLNANQAHLIKSQEKTADMLERQAIAIERILDYLITPK